MVKCVLEWLTLNHTILGFNDSVKEVIRKHCGKKRKWWKPAFSPFVTMFSTLARTNLTNFNLLSANAMHLDQAEILLFPRQS